MGISAIRLAREMFVQAQLSRQLQSQATTLGCTCCFGHKRQPRHYSRRVERSFAQCCALQAYSKIKGCILLNRRFTTEVGGREAFEKVEV